MTKRTLITVFALLTATSTVFAGWKDIRLLRTPPTAAYEELSIVGGSDLCRDYDDMVEELKKNANDIHADAVIIDTTYFAAVARGDHPGEITGMAIRFKTTETK